MRTKSLRLAALLAIFACLGAFIVLRARRKTDLNTQISTRMTYDADAGVAPVEDWPRWRGPRGDGISREVIAEKWPEGGPRKLWSADVGLGYSSPVAAGGRVYLFSMNNRREALTCFDARSGRIVWNDEADAGWVEDYPGTRSTPAVDGDAIYTYGGAGDLVCRDLATGRPRWAVNVLKLTGSSPLQWGTASSPLVVLGNVYVQSGKGGAVAVAVNKDDGKVVWKSEATGVGGYAQAVLADVQGTPQLVVFAGDAVVGMDPLSGRTLWSTPWATNYNVNGSTPVYADGNLFVTSEYGMGCLTLKVTPQGATKQWAHKQVKSRFQQTVLDGAALYANSSGTLTCIAWPDGAVKWKEKDAALGDNGSLVRIAPDKLLLMSDGGEVTLGRATADKPFESLATFRAFDDEHIWSTPLVYGGRLYAKGKREFACFDLSGAAR